MEHNGIFISSKKKETPKMNTPSPYWYASLLPPFCHPLLSLAPPPVLCYFVIISGILYMLIGLID